MNLENEITQFLSDPARKKQLMDAAMKAMEERVTQQFNWQLPDHVTKICDEFIKEHVAPAVRARLIEQKGAIIEAAVSAADEIGAKLSQTIVQKATEQLDRSYSANAIIKTLFGQ